MLSACADKKNSNTLNVKIGLITANTENTAAYSESIIKGLKLANEEINNHGKIKIDLVIENSEGNPEKALECLNKLINIHKVSAIIGPLLSSEMIYIGHTAEENKMTLLATSNTAIGIPQIGSYIFRNSMGEDQAVPAALKKTIDKYNAKTAMLLVCNNDVFTKSSAEIMKKASKKLNLKIIEIFNFQKSNTDFKAVIEKIKAANPDVILCSALYNDGAVFLNQARQSGLKQPVVGGNGFNSPKIIEIAQSNADSLIVATAWFPDKKNSIAEAFIKKFQQKFNSKPDQFAAQAYDGLYLINEAIKQSHSIDRALIRNALSEIKNFKGVLGVFSFDKDGDIEMEPNVLIVENKKFKLL